MDTKITLKKQIIRIGIGFLCFIPLFAFSNKNHPDRNDNLQSIQSSFDPKIAKWNITWPGKVSQYDLVYKSPPIDPLQGIALGNGDVGALFWCEGSKLIAQINKSDLWDDALLGTFHNWNPEEEDYSTTQRHACRIIIDFKFPVFNTLYLTDFDGRLSLVDASLKIKATSPFGEISIEAFVDHKSGILFYDMNSNMNEDVPIDITIERFGSRTFSHWYSQINRNSSIGLSGTEAVADDNGVYITQKLTSGTFAAGGCVIKNNDLRIKYSREHPWSTLTCLSGNRIKDVQLAFSVTSPKPNNPISELKNVFSSVQNNEVDRFWKSHTEVWNSIWNRSFMDYGDDYLNNLWYLTMYYANASQGGKYPGRFINGLWGWNRDVQPWNFYFHWNQQQLYWPLNAAGFHELINPYLDFRFNSLPQAKKDAQEFFNAEGAYISDVTEHRGYNSTSENENHTPVAEIALDFWRQYQYTCDKDFLEKKALPFIIEAARFFESLLIKEDDGLYHAKEGTGYEGWIKLKDALTELVYAKVLFATALEALEATAIEVPEVTKWKEILENLAPLPTIPAGKEVISSDNDGPRLLKGIFKGKNSPTDTIMAAGWGIKENKWLTVFYNDTTSHQLKWHEGIFPIINSSPVFPSGLIGLYQKGTALFRQISATALLYGTTTAPGWNPIPIVYARLGLSEELTTTLKHFPERWQVYYNGWGHWSPNKDEECFFNTNKVNDVDSNEQFPLRMWPFRHMAMEPMSIMTTAMNESLLQSYDGILRVFPAFSSDNGRFTLHAAGGFIVSSEIKSGKVKWICIKSLHGNPCKVKIPWDKAILQSNQKRKSKLVEGDIVEINTSESEIITILPDRYDVGLWSIVQENPMPNKSVKYHPSGEARLGIPRMF